MMKIDGNALVVEDEDSWSEVYARAARKVGLNQITITDTYEKAARAIDETRFAVAIVDIGLSVDDDRNVDGLHVMEKIRAIGDETSIIVVTGRSGRDVVLQGSRRHGPGRGLHRVPQPVLYGVHCSSFR